MDATGDPQFAPAIAALQAEIRFGRLDREVVQAWHDSIPAAGDPEGAAGQCGYLTASAIWRAYQSGEMVAQ